MTDEQKIAIEQEQSQTGLDSTRKQQQRERIGQRVADLRKAAGMTQRQLGDACGLQNSHIARIEKGKYSVGFDTLQAIAEALGCTVDFLKIQDL